MASAELLAALAAADASGVSGLNVSQKDIVKTQMLLGANSLAAAFAAADASGVSGLNVTQRDIIKTQMLLDAGSLLGSFAAADASGVSGLNVSQRNTVKTQMLLAGAGGAPSLPFSPPDLGGLEMWLEGDSLGVVDNQPINEWDDLSGNGHHVEQPTGSLQPIYKVNILNGHAVVRFDAADDFLASATFASELAQPNTVFLVNKWADTTTRTGFDGIDVNKRNMLYLTAADGFVAYAGTDQALKHQIPVQHLRWNLHAITYNGAASTYWLNRAVLATGNPGTMGLTGITLGRFAAPNQAVSGDIAELIIYNRALSDAERQQVEDYLATKYAIAGLLAGLDAWWSLDTTAPAWRDESGNGQVLGLFGTVPVVAGKIEGAASFNGVSGNFLEREPPDNFELFPWAGFSGQAWVKVHSLGADMSLFGNADKSTGTPTGWRLMYQGGPNGIALEGNDDDSIATERNLSSVPVVLNQWHHVVWTVTVAGDSHIWVDGVKDSDEHLVATDTTTSFHIGTDGSNTQPANADIDEVALWIGRVLTDAEAAWLWNSGTGRSYLDLT